MSMFFNVLAGQVAAKLEFDPAKLFDPAGGTSGTTVDGNHLYYTANDGGAISVSSSNLFGDLNDKFGMYFKFDDVSDPALDTGFYSNSGISSGDADFNADPPTPPSFIVSAAVEITNSGGVITKQLASLGHSIFGGADSSVGPWNLTINADTEFCVAYDKDASQYGTAYFYSSEQPDTPIATHAFISAHNDPIEAFGYISGASGPNGITILSNPSVEHDGVRNVGA